MAAELIDLSTSIRGNSEYLAPKSQKPKSFACILCRRRKLKCDGKRPKCMTCQRLGHVCDYKELAPGAKAQRTSIPSRSKRPLPHVSSDHETPGNNNVADKSTSGASWCPAPLVLLGLQESLPPQHVIDELHEIFFTRISAFMPMIHRARYLAKSQLPPNIGTPVCLRYAIWALASSISLKHKPLEEIFYRRARRYAEGDELRGLGVSVLTIEHVQCWCLLSQYESEKMCYPRAWMSVGRCVRLAQMLGLHQVDKTNPGAKQILPPARDWIEVETRRRTFWSAFHVDRWATCGTGWPVIIDDREILTNLPGSEEAYSGGVAEVTPTIYSVREGTGISYISPFAGTIIIADLVGRLREHLHEERHAPLLGDLLEDQFWARHNKLDNDISSLFLFLPDNLKLPAGVKDANAVFVNMNIHSLVISLHSTAASRPSQGLLGTDSASRSQARCRTAADEIVDILRLTSHLELAKMNPYMAFNLYMAAVVFLQRATSADSQSPDKDVANLRFIRAAMQAIKSTHAVTGSFLLQLEMDMDKHGLYDGTADYTDVGASMQSDVGQGEESNTADQTTMAEDLKRYQAVPISLNGILPVRRQKHEAESADAAPGFAELTDASLDMMEELSSTWDAGHLFGPDQDFLDEDLQSSDNWLADFDNEQRII